jgi:hypothetical protein
MSICGYIWDDNDDDDHGQLISHGIIHHTINSLKLIIHHHNGILMGLSMNNGINMGLTGMLTCVNPIIVQS